MCRTKRPDARKATTSVAVENSRALKNARGAAARRQRPGPCTQARNLRLFTVTFHPTCSRRECARRPLLRSLPQLLSTVEQYLPARAQA